MSHKVSVIVTCFNNGHLLQHCVDSILNSSYKNLEIIIIDDASTDNSIDIIDKISDSRVIKLYNDYNIGAGLSRRKALMAATGDFIMFVDSDDSIDRFFIEVLLNKAVSTGADIVEGGVQYVDGRVWTRQDSVVEKIEDKVKYFFEKPLKFVNVGLYRKKLIDQSEAYCERPYIEDTPSYIHWLLSANKIVSINYPGYNYYTNPDSLTHTASKYKNLLFTVLGALDIQKAVKKFGINLWGSEQNLINILKSSLKLSGAYLEYTPEYDLYLQPLLKM